jgi:cell division septum initiation protein DivIVA
VVPQATGDDGAVADELTDLAARLEQAKFTIAFRGFEPREVHALIAEAVTQLRLLTHASGDGASPVENDATRIRRVATAEDEAAEIVRAAREEADRIIGDALHEAAELRKEAAEFREQARASVLEGIRDANFLMQRARDERSGPS